jgi:hypothetical protein
MNKFVMKRSPFLWLLELLLVFLALGGLYGGISFLVDPTGEMMQMNAVLPLLPVPDYTLPGIFLVTVMGVFPLLFTFGLIRLPAWSRADSLSAWSRHYWAWTGSVGVGIVLVVWLAVQGYLIGFQWPIQFITLANGILIVLAAMIPGIEKYFRR